MYAAKAVGRETLKMFAPSMRAEVERQLSMFDLARSALKVGLIEPFYQPKIALATGKVAGFEALLRWRDPVLGIQSPETIAGAFDETGLAGPLGDAMAEAVLVDIRKWTDSGIDVGKIAINASAATLPWYIQRPIGRSALSLEARLFWKLWRLAPSASPYLEAVPTHARYFYRGYDLKFVTSQPKAGKCTQLIPARFRSVAD